MSRIKPGDLCLIRAAGPYGGRLVEALRPAPCVRFRLPDGRLHEAAAPNCWIFMSLGSPFEAALDDGTFLPVMYGVTHERFLIPVRGEDTPAEVVRELEMEAAREAC
jgi:hypothetical protein